MAKVLIYSDEETYGTFVREAWDDGGPSRDLPVEIPDDIFEAYQAAKNAEKRLRLWIIATYGWSPRNPNYEQELNEFLSQNADDSAKEAVEDDGSKPFEWAEYYTDDDS